LLPSAITDFFSADLVAAISSLLVMGIGVVIAYLKVVQSKINAQLKDLHRGVSEVGTVVESVKDQTHNDHSTNLRDDIDALGGKLDGVSELLADVAHTQQLQGQEISAHGKVLAQLQAAQQQDRAERIALDSHAHDEHERIWQELDRIKKKL
jgi:hypothetical protein